jgi:pilus assembly protein CpaB
VDSKRPVILLLVFAAVSALVAGWIYQRLSSVAARGERGDTVLIAIATQDLVPGTRISADLASSAFTRRSWPRELVPPDAVDRADTVIGQMVRAPVYAGEPLYRFKLAAADGGGVLSAAVSDGMRAFTVPVDEVTGVGGYVLPGAYVDVIGTFRNVRESMFGQPRGETFSKVILERVKVLASGPQMEQNDVGARSRSAPAGSRQTILTRDKATPTSATLLVTPGQAESLALAVKEGSIHLALRNYQDEAPGQTTGVTKQELLGLAEPEPDVVPRGRGPAAPEPSGPAVEMIRGSERSSVSF